MTHSRIERVVGPNLVLRLITPDDADYLHALRVDPAYNTHLSEVRGTAEDQRRWIESYKAREAAGEELYYVIERRDGVRCGVVRLYEIGAESFTWGSWILDHNKPRKAALESAVLIYTIGFELLHLPKAVFEVRRDNEHTIAFHERFKARRTHANDDEIFFEYSSSQFAADKPHYVALIEAQVAERSTRHFDIAAVENLPRPAKVDLGVGASALYLMRRVVDARGALSVGEVPTEVPFYPARYFVVFDVPSTELRGEHAHRECEQFLMCVHGSVRLLLDDGTNRCEVTLDRPDMGVFMPTMIWGTQYQYSRDAVMLVFASRPYEAEDYIRSYDDFLSEIKAQKG